MDAKKVWRKQQHDSHPYDYNIVQAEGSEEIFNKIREVYHIGEDELGI